VSDLKRTGQRGQEASLKKRSEVMLTKLLFSNIPWDCSEDLLREWVEEHGYPVLSVKLIRDIVSGTSPSFAHVQLTGASGLDEAERSLNGQVLLGRPLHVSRYAPLSVTTQRARAAGLNLR
jgi:RNA recognition motif-containing protein